MKTDWDIIREMMNVAINACETIEKTGYAEFDRSTTMNIEGQQVSIHDMLVSAWTYPENMGYQIIRERHETDNNLTYVPETARILLAMAQAAAELVNTDEAMPAEEKVRSMISWFTSHLIPNIEIAIATGRKDRLFSTTGK
ncbi:hypothetical protein ACLBWZ_06220 [Brucellaceae bacterium C25G]